MSKAALYLEAQFLRYFPEAFIDVTFHDDGSAVDVEGEAIEVNVRDTPASDPDYTFIMSIGSDDDWFSFSCGDLVITVPFDPEGD